MKTLVALFVIAIAAVGSYGQKEIRLDRTGVDPLSTEGMKRAGKFSSQGYENWVLGFSIAPPVGFEKIEDPETKEVLEKGIAEANAVAQKKQTEKPVSVSQVLFHYAAKTGSLAAGLEKVGPQITSRSYAESNITNLKKYPQARISKPLAERTIGGRSWQYYEVELTTNGVIVRQIYIMRIELGHGLFLVSSIADPALEKDIVASLNSVKFKN